MRYSKLSRRWSPQLYSMVSFPFEGYFIFGRKCPRRVNGKMRDVRIWRFQPWAAFKTLFERYNWYDNCYPSYTTGLQNVWDNLMIFLTPWYRTRRHLMNDLANLNSSKILASSRKRLVMRDRDGHDAYFYITFGPVYGTVEMVQYVTRDGETHNLFMSGILALADAKSCEEPKEVRKLLFRAPALTDRQCVAFLNRTAEATEKYLKWYD